MIFKNKLVWRYSLILILCFCGLVFIFWWQDFRQIQQPLIPLSTSKENIILNEPIQPITLQLELNESKVKLGDKLFHEFQLSKDNKVACVSCHNLNTGGTDRLVRSIGTHNKLSVVSSPTVFNSGLNFKQFWDGRAETLEAQAEQAILGGNLMGKQTWLEVINKLKQFSKYDSWFRQLYLDGMTSDNIKDAIATFERSLYTPNSRFDQFLLGNQNAISEEEKQGYHRFKSYGCVSCHQGMLLGGNMFQTFGLLENYFSDRGKVTRSDFGRFNVTKDERDRYAFKVPSLRNIVLTSPYFHDGSAENLEEAIKVMAKYQLGRQIPQTDINLIIKFLKSLTGKYQGKPL